MGIHFENFHWPLKLLLDKDGISLSIEMTKQVNGYTGIFIHHNDISNFLREIAQSDYELASRRDRFYQSREIKHGTRVRLADTPKMNLTYPGLVFSLPGEILPNKYLVSWSPQISHNSITSHHRHELIVVEFQDPV